MNSTIRTNAEITVSKEVEAAFIEKLRNELAGFYDRNDIKYMEGIIADAEKHIPEYWQSDTKKEFVYFLEACAEIYAENLKNG